MCIGLRDLKIALVQGLIGYFARYVSSREFSVSTRVFGFVLTSAESQRLWRELTPQDYGSVANIEIQFFRDRLSGAFTWRLSDRVRRQRDRKRNGAFP